MQSSKTLLITGVSSGFGRALAEEALAVGHRVVGTVRSTQARRDFESRSAGGASGRILGVTDFDAIEGIVEEIAQAWVPSMCWSTTPATGTKTSWKNPLCRRCVDNSM